MGIAWIILKSLQWAAAVPQSSSDLVKKPAESANAASIIPQKSIVVLPFKNIGADPEQDYFCEGLAEELINVLTQVKDLRVVARTSAFSFQGKDEDIREMRGRSSTWRTCWREASGRPAKSCGSPPSFINVADGYHLWSERFDREMTDVFAIQDEIAQADVAKNEEWAPKQDNGWRTQALHRER